MTDDLVARRQERRGIALAERMATRALALLSHAAPGPTTEIADVGRQKLDVVTWWRKAAEQGDAAAQFALGWAYADGRGVPQDNGEAVKWWRAAAEQGHADAQDSLAVAYLHGRGVPADDYEAVVWWRKAAAQGHADAQDSLDWAHRHHRGIDESDDDDDDGWSRSR